MYIKYRVAILSEYHSIHPYILYALPLIPFIIGWRQSTPWTSYQSITNVHVLWTVGWSYNTWKTHTCRHMQTPHREAWLGMFWGGNTFFRPWIKGTFVALYDSIGTWWPILRLINIWIGWRITVMQQNSMQQEAHCLAHDSWINFSDISTNCADKTVMLVKHAPAVISYDIGRGMQDLVWLHI